MRTWSDTFQYLPSTQKYPRRFSRALCQRASAGAQRAHAEGTHRFPARPAWMGLMVDVAWVGARSTVKYMRALDTLRHSSSGTGKHLAQCLGRSCRCSAE